MEVIIRPDVEDAAALTARIIANAIIDKPRLVLGLATGRTSPHSLAAQSAA